jgi:ABC-2 type transport system ATP-binding protein
MIVVEQLTKRYGPHTAIQDVSFRVEKGEVLAFLGPNGAGKSTTMRILTGLLPPTSGRASVSGFDTFDHPIEVKKRVGYLPETPPLYNELTVREYLTFAGRIKGVPKFHIPASLNHVLERCGLTDVVGRLIGNLSKGYRQRVGLAQALIHDPDVLILDEPTVGLDPKQIIDIRQLIKELAGQHTVILSTHILQEATALCQRVIIIHEGRIRAVDSPDRLSTQLRHSEKIQLSIRETSPGISDALQSIPGVIQVLSERVANNNTFIIESDLGRDIREEVARCIVGNNWGLLELKNVSMTLEDVFLKLTREEQSTETTP